MNKVEHREYAKCWKAANPDRVREHWLAKMRKIKRIVRTARRRPCHDCGEMHPWWRMEFDHVRGPVTRRFSRLASIKKVTEELEKCDVVCANCHRDREHRRGTFKGRK